MEALYQLSYGPVREKNTVICLTIQASSISVLDEEVLMIHPLFQPLASTLFKIGAVKFGSFKLKLHETQPDAPFSPICFNLRTAEHPKPGPLMESHINLIAHVFQAIMDLHDIKFDGVCAIPNAGTPLVLGLQNIVCKALQILEVSKHDEGNRRHIDAIVSTGGLHRGASVLLVDDVITGAHTKLEVIRLLRKAGFTVHDLLVIVDRQQGGAKILEDDWVRVHEIFKLTDLLDFYVEKGWIHPVKSAQVRAYLGID